MSDTIDLETQKFGLSGGKLLAVIGMLAGSLFGAGMAASQLASEDYVNTKGNKFEAALLKLAEAQTATTQQVGTLANRVDQSDRDMKTMARLVKIQFIEHVDMQEARSPRAKRRPRSAKFRHVAEMLNLDPDDPMAGLELLETTP